MPTGIISNGYFYIYYQIQQKFEPTHIDRKEISVERSPFGPTSKQKM